jgi:hypothetical protein
MREHIIFSTGPVDFYAYPLCSHTPTEIMLRNVYGLVDLCLILHEAYLKSSQYMETYDNVAVCLMYTYFLRLRKP